MPDYHENKAKGIIRESMFKAVEIVNGAESRLKESGNPYASLDVEASISSQINELTEHVYAEVRKCITFNS